MDEAPSHAARIEQEARQDGVNPYNGESYHPQTQDLDTLQPSYHQQHPVQGVSNTAVPSEPIAVKDRAGEEHYFGVNPGPHELPSRERGDESALHHHNSGEYTTQQTTILSGTGQFANSSWQPSSAVSDDTLTSDLTSPVRPWAGRRTDSIPHVPGEYPRSLVATAPGV